MGEIIKENLPITKARVNLGAVVESVRSEGKRVTLEKGGIPVAMIVDIDLLEDMQDAIDLMRARLAGKDELLVNWTSIRQKYV